MKKEARIFFLLMLPWVLPRSVFAANLGTDEQKAFGKKLYEKHCAQCHGEKGDGQGPGALFYQPQPRDFTKGKYKIRTTPNGELPTDDDLKRAIHQGLAFQPGGAYTVMPPWPKLSEEQLIDLVYYLKIFSPRFADSESNNPKVISIPEPPAFSRDSAEKGRVVYEKNECIKCHGLLGRGDGRSAPTLKDDWENSIRPADLTMKWTFRGGGTRKDIFRTVSTGLNGTPMPSYVDSISEEDRWHLVDYLSSLSKRDFPEYNKADQPIVVAGTQGVIELGDLIKAKELFKNSQPSFIAVVGQVIEPGREFHPAVNEIEVKAIYNQHDIALMLVWHDMKADASGTNSPDLKIPLEEDVPVRKVEEKKENADPFAEDQAAEEKDPFADDSSSGGQGAQESTSQWSDAVAIQLPVAPAEGSFKLPYFLFGDPGAPVELLFADLAKKEAQVFLAKGSSDMKPDTEKKVELVSGYDNGEWTVIFKRKRDVTEGLALQEQSFVPIAFSVWDGVSLERGMKRGITGWYQLYLEPMQKKSVLGPVFCYGIGLFVLELAVIWYIRRRRSDNV